MAETRTHTLAVPGVDLVYDVRGPLPPSDGRPPLLMIGQPMTAEGFDALGPHFPDRTVVTYDPRGLGRSIRTDGRSDHTPQQQALAHLLLPLRQLICLFLHASTIFCPALALTRLDWSSSRLQL